ncbi:MAG: TetR/AcrR family transcriptional regulator [bacterium]|nr:TetR/AcrR family transcriptional regulator [bacterium]
MPKIVDHDQYRDELLTKCFDLFASRGYSEVTMREIAKELQISTGSLYHYFPTKQAILQQMFTLLLKRIIEEMVSALIPFEEQDKKINFGFNYIREREDFFKNFFLMTIEYYRYGESEEKHTFMQTFLKDIRNNLVTHFDIDESVSEMIFSFITGLVYQRTVYYEFSSFEKQVTLFQKMLNPFLKKEKK